MFEIRKIIYKKHTHTKKENVNHEFSLLQMELHENTTSLLLIILIPPNVTKPEPGFLEIPKQFKIETTTMVDQ